MIASDVQPRNLVQFAPVERIFISLPFCVELLWTPSIRIFSMSQITRNNNQWWTNSCNHIMTKYFQTSRNREVINETEMNIRNLHKHATCNKRSALSVDKCLYLYKPKYIVRVVIRKRWAITLRLNFSYDATIAKVAFQWKHGNPRQKGHSSNKNKLQDTELHIFCKRNKRHS